MPCADAASMPLFYMAFPHFFPPQVYLADWFSIQVAAKVLIVGQVGSPGDAQRALTLSAPIMAKLEAEASLLASLR